MMNPEPKSALHLLNSQFSGYLIWMAGRDEGSEDKTSVGNCVNSPILHPYNTIEDNSPIIANAPLRSNPTEFIRFEPVKPWISIHGL